MNGVNIFRFPLLGALLFSCAFAEGISASHAQSMIPGDLIVSVYGDTNNASLLDGQPTPITLEEFSLDGTTSATQDNAFVLTNIVGEYGSSSEGTIQLSGNGEYLTIGGYNASEAYAGDGAPGNGVYENSSSLEPNDIALAQSASASVARLAGVIDTNGDLVSSTSFSDIYSGNNIRSVYSATGASIYVSGQGPKGVTNNQEQGIFYSTAGASYSTNSTAPQGIYTKNDSRTVTSYNGNLYYSIDQKASSKDGLAAQTGIFEYSGNPTNSQGSSKGVQIIPANNGLTGTNEVNYSPEGFFFASTNTLYVADTGDPKEGGTGDGGIQKWSLTNGIWDLDYTITDTNFVNPALAASVASGQTGFEALTGAVVGNNVYLYAVSYTADDCGSNGLYAVTDILNSTNDIDAPITELEAAPGTNGTSADFNFKGVSFTPQPQTVPEPSTWALVVLSSVVVVVFARARRRIP
jgi:hypothetical protein